MLRLALLVAAGLCLAVGTAQLIPSLISHQESRNTWLQIRASQGTAHYDPAASDQAYGRSRDAHRTAGHAGWLVAIALFLFAAGWRPARARPESTPHVHRAALLRATLIDGGLAWLLGSLYFLDGSGSAMLHALQSASPILFFLPFAALVHGSSLGLRSQGLAVEGRLDLAVFLGPFALIALPLAFWWKPATAIHLVAAKRAFR